MMLSRSRQSELPSEGRRTATWVAALCGGAVVQYLLDPTSGRTRRARLADKTRAALRRPAKEAADQAGQKMQVARDKTVGTLRGAVSASEPPPNDQALADKIRSEVLGSAAFRDYTLLVDSANGNVTLRGHVKQPDEINALERRVKRIKGVGEVTNLVHLPGTDPKNIHEPMEASRGGRGPRPS